ncbi:MAG TPA: hypothetical protein VIM70_18335 [Clostridium sp.]|jgi:hypothetical protein|uniref:hypothetical protein n=1 Tax=Bacteria TaxID=2 RepID=UPI0025B98829|nr:hypothetical protein [Flavobacterium sp. UBA4120]
MSEEDSKKQGKSIHHAPEIKKGNDAERGGFDQVRNKGNLSEGYQPIRDIIDTSPPDGGSGVPDKDKDS